jgi:hypothetical protein
MDQLRTHRDMGITPRLTGRRHVRRGIAAGIAILVLLLQPASAFADVYSATVWLANRTPIGEQNTDYCTRAGVVDVARNYGAVYAYLNGGGPHDCLGTGHVLPAGWIGVKVEGFKDGVSCGISSWYFSSQAAWGWQLWITMCPNPTGQQQFQSRSYINVYLGDAYSGPFTGPISPVATY